MFIGHATVARQVRRATRVLLAAGALSCALSQAAPAGGYVAPVIEYPVESIPVRGVATAMPPNAGWWLLGGAVVLCLIFCFGDDDENRSSEGDDTRPGTPPPRTNVPTPEMPAPVPLPGALVATLTATGALWTLRRKRRKS